MKKALFALCLTAVAAQASASLVFSDRNTWVAAVTGMKTVNFEGLTSANSVVSEGASKTIDNVAFTSPSGSMYVIGQNYAESGGTFGFGTGATLFSYAPGVHGTLPDASNAFAINLRGYLESTTQFTLLFSDGESFNISANNPSGAFFGAILNNAITGFTVQTSSRFLAIDNVSFANANATSRVPEPSALALVAVALAGLTLAGRRRQRKGTQA